MKKDWMEELASHYESARDKYPRLCGQRPLHLQVGPVFARDDVVKVW